METLEDDRSPDTLENTEAYQQLEDDLTEPSDSLIGSETETTRRN
ncbi:hypothetical protein [Natronorubrum halophilum]|nr:hypothetical protein [Natronorubrum halophilum]